MVKKDFIIGTLKSGGYLETASGEVLLTKISMQAAQSPESALLKVSPEDTGKMALVRGNLSSNVLYAANIVEFFSSFISKLIKKLLKKGVASPEELKNELSDVASEVIETNDQKKLCALVIGHKKSSPGAKNSKSNLTEFDFNEDLALRIEKMVKKSDVQRIYRRIYKELPDDINALGPNFIVSLHCNAFNKKATGTEVLYYHKSEPGKKMAEILLNYLVEYLELPNRGIKPKTSEERGGYVLRYTNAPCVISEPFFIDNDKDLERATRNINELAEIYANAIDDISLSIV
ncbi:MAG: N-acetylmuramoyl-L-alanine amidase [Desulfobacteraceae bacterium]|nr:N-acetylmuramoyl-L-alanine amidase [Desulfobacteraceae bacterium]